jgi:hypothetical protein
MEHEFIIPNKLLCIMEIGCSSNINQKSRFLLSATFSCNSNGCYEVMAHGSGCLHPYPVGCLHAIQISLNEMTEQSVLKHRQD